MNDPCLIKRSIDITPCTEVQEDDCHRTFYLYLPYVVCKTLQANANVGVHDDGDGRGNGSALDSGLPSDPVGDVGTLPLVFAVHCFGCSAM